MKSSSNREYFHEGLRLISTCPICETRYHPTQARLLGRDGETHVFHVQCRKCHHSILACVLVNTVGSSSIGLLTDLDSDDVLAFRANANVSMNDVIESHTLFSGMDWQKRLGPIREKKPTRAHKKLRKLKE